MKIVLRIGKLEAIESFQQAAQTVCFTEDFLLVGTISLSTHLYNSLHSANIIVLPSLLLPLKQKCIL